MAGGSSFTTTLAGTTAGTQYGQFVIAAGGSIVFVAASFFATVALAKRTAPRALQQEAH